MKFKGSRDNAYNKLYQYIYFRVRGLPGKESCDSAGERKETIARIQYELLAGGSYVYTSDDVIYLSVGERKGIDGEDFFLRGKHIFGRPLWLRNTAGESTLMKKARLSSFI